MLVGFFKEAAAKNCDAKVVQFSDRIWANDDLSVTVLRVFSITASAASTDTLKRINMLIGPPIESVVGLNDNAFDANLYWNAPERRTSNQYEILKVPSSAVKGDRGHINDDQLQVDVFADRDVRLATTNIGGSSLISIEFPEVIRAGERIQSRVKFRIPNALVKNPAAPRVEYICNFDYFHSAPVAPAVRILGGMDCCIPILARYRSPVEGSGFTIIFYAPPGFERGNGFDASPREALDTHLEDGTQSKSRVRFLWQLDELLERDRTDPNIPITCSSYVRINGSLIQSDKGETIADLREKVDSMDSEVRKSTIIAIASAVLALIGIAAALWPMIFPSGAASH